ncbi:MAG TPA: PilZ domain-containing protein [Gemmatimonadaceae bacterium]
MPSLTPTIERRSAPRVNAHALPWITSVRSLDGDSARLLNISRTGALLETTAPLEPGHRSTIVIVNDAEQRELVDSQVMRSELVAVGRRGELVYRVAVAFGRDLVLPLPGVARDEQQVADSCVQPRLEGPISGLWASASGSWRVEITHLAETGCYVRSPQDASLHEAAAISIFPSPAHSIMLRGMVVAAEPGRGCLLRFEQPTPENRRALRTAIREGITRGASAPPQPVAVGVLTRSAEAGTHFVEWRARAGAVHADPW